MFIVYEGTDCSGKTTTRKLVEKQRDGKDVVIDRFIGSNIVYGLIFKRYTEEKFKILYVDDYRFASMFNPVLIYLYAPVKEIVKRMKKDGHEEIDKEILTKTLKEYNKYFDRCGYENKIKINTSRYDQKDVVKKIINFLKHVENK
ncbi:MAG: hypothetical protein WC346_03155 [Methanogenium sp.]|jgi:thymidylate kinase